MSNFGSMKELVSNGTPTEGIVLPKAVEDYFQEGLKEVEKRYRSYLGKITELPYFKEENNPYSDIWNEVRTKIKKREVNSYGVVNVAIDPKSLCRFFGCSLHYGVTVADEGEMTSFGRVHYNYAYNIEHVYAALSENQKDLDYMTYVIATILYGDGSILYKDITYRELDMLYKCSLVG